MGSDEQGRREQVLRRAILAGDERAWQTWYDEAFDRLAAYVTWRCGGMRDLAEDAIQETWLTAVRHIRRFDPVQGRFIAWLRGIAANVVRDHLRRARRPPPPGRTVAVPDAELEARERAEQVAHALAELPPHYEEVLRAKYLDGQSVAAIAAARGETPKAVESLLTRARNAFRDAYRPQE